MNRYDENDQTNRCLIVKPGDSLILAGPSSTDESLADALQTVREAFGLHHVIVCDRLDAVEVRNFEADLADAQERLAGLTMALEQANRLNEKVLGDLDDLTEQLSRVTQSRDDLRSAMRAAYEPAQSERCRKIRYLHRHDAERHAIDVADRTGDEGAWNAYECRWCPPHPGYRTRFWHVGHCRAGDAGAIRVQSGLATYGCGCVFSARSDAVLWRCTDHAEREAS